MQSLTHNTDNSNLKADTLHCETLGMIAYAKGINCAPCLDKDMMDRLAGRRIGDGRTSPELSAWSAGWIKASLAAAMPETSTPACWDAIEADDVAPISGGAPSVDELVAERLEAVEAIAEAITSRVGETQDQKIDRLSRSIRSHVLDSIISVTNPYATGHRYDSWHDMGNASRADFLALMDMLGYAREYWDQDECFEPDFGRWIRFIDLCVTGSEVRFSVSPLDPTDRTIMEELFNATVIVGGPMGLMVEAIEVATFTSEEISDVVRAIDSGTRISLDTRSDSGRVQREDSISPSGLAINGVHDDHDNRLVRTDGRSGQVHRDASRRPESDLRVSSQEMDRIQEANGTQLIINGVTYGLTVLDDGFDLCKRDGVCHRVTVTADGVTCDCPSAKYRPGRCKHADALIAAGMLPGPDATQEPDPCQEKSDQHQCQNLPSFASYGSTSPKTEQPFDSTTDRVSESAETTSVITNPSADGYVGKSMPTPNRGFDSLSDPDATQLDIPIELEIHDMEHYDGTNERSSDQHHSGESESNGGGNQATQGREAFAPGYTGGANRRLGKQLSPLDRPCRQGALCQEASQGQKRDRVGNTLNTASANPLDALTFDEIQAWQFFGLSSISGGAPEPELRGCCQVCRKIHPVTSAGFLKTHEAIPGVQCLGVDKQPSYYCESPGDTSDPELAIIPPVSGGVPFGSDTEEEAQLASLLEKQLGAIKLIQRVNPSGHSPQLYWSVLAREDQVVASGSTPIIALNNALRRIPEPVSGESDEADDELLRELEGISHNRYFHQNDRDVASGAIEEITRLRAEVVSLKEVLTDVREDLIGALKSIPADWRHHSGVRAIDQALASP